MLWVHCAKCDTVFQVPASRATRSVRCSRCNTPIAVRPSNEAATTPPEAEAFIPYGLPVSPPPPKTAEAPAGESFGKRVYRHLRESANAPSPASAIGQWFLNSPSPKLASAGGFTLVFGLITAVCFFVMDTTVEVPRQYIFGQQIGGERVYNFGLMQTQRNGLTVSLFAVGAGLFMLVMARRNNGPTIPPVPTGTPGGDIPQSPAQAQEGRAKHVQ